MSSSSGEDGQGHPNAMDGPPKIRERDDVHVDTPTTGYQGPFFQAVGRRKLEGRDAKVLVTAKNAQTGVGKSNCCDFCAYVCDTTHRGFTVDKIAIQPEEFFSLYGVLELGSSVVMEEGEQLDPRRSMSKKNVEASHTWQMERVREIVAFINLPSPKFIDGRMEELADYWINVLRRGRARIYEKKIHDTKGYLYYETLQDLEWPNMDGSDTFRQMGELKQKLIDGEMGGNWVPPDEHEEAIRRAEKKTREEVRNQLLKDAYLHTDLTGGDIARWPSIDISASRVRQIANDTT